MELYINPKNKKKILIILIFGLTFYFCYALIILYQEKTKLNKSIKIEWKTLDTGDNTKIILKQKIIKEIQENLQNVFAKKQNQEKNKVKPLKIKSHQFKKGEIVYGFVLDTENNLMPFQEGIISEDYNVNKYYEPLAISIKGKSNKIFFNSKGQFIGLSIPYQSSKYAINFILTSNSIHHFLKNKNISQNIHKNNKQSSYDLPIYYETDNEKKIYHQIGLDQKGLFMGLHNANNDLDQKGLFMDLHNANNDVSNLKQKNKAKEEEDNLYKHIKDISDITFQVRIRNKISETVNFGSCFIYKVEKKHDTYEYFLLTNKHVVEVINENEKDWISMSIYDEQNKKISTIDIKDIKIYCEDTIYDDIAVFKFKYPNKQFYEKIVPILQKTISKNYKNINIEQTAPVYSMGSQVNKIPNIDFIDLKDFPIKFKSNNPLFQILQTIYPEITDSIIRHESSFWKNNLLKKGHVNLRNEKRIYFDINIDKGNSGGPLFNENGQIIGMNANYMEYTPLVDKFSGAIPLNYIFKKIDLIDAKQNNENIQKNEIISFLNFENVFSNDQSELPKKTFSKEYSIFTKNFKKILKEKSLQSQLIKRNSNTATNPKILLNIYYFSNQYDDKKHVFTLNPFEDKIDISIKNNEIIFNNENEKKTFLSEDNDHSFFDFELEISNNQDSFSPKKKEKIENELVIWEGNINNSGNGIIFRKETIAPNHFMYYVLSNYNAQMSNLFFQITHKIINLFIDDVQILTHQNGIYKKEKGKIKSFFFGKHNLALITFESNENYNCINMRDTKNLNLGEKTNFLINTQNQNYFPQVFKGNIGYITEPKNEFLVDAVFKLQTDTKNPNFQKQTEKLNFLCFDAEKNFIGFNNNILEKNIPSNFIQFSNTKNTEIQKLLIESIIKNNFNIIFSFFFLTISSFIIVLIMPTKKILNLEEKNKFIKDFC
ncbi:hypothetical protein C6B37_01180 [Candidatus Phytoplasma phoenicium]|uniref:Serine protease n=1 Tax=Candidatus Phytoplasma phoenicium TaxID=198422 RepID=A0A2S8NV04_9MOLU|nr:hypothetical protein C6B37_01180 [Candidatus Phytoplasma phoenicium]